MERVGIRELKEQASEIVRQVREEGIAYEITFHGRVAAHLTPVEPGELGTTAEEWLAQLDQLAEDISARWPAGVTAVDAVNEQRREF